MKPPMEAHFLHMAAGSQPHHEDAQMAEQSQQQNAGEEERLEMRTARQENEQDKQRKE